MNKATSKTQEFEKFVDEMERLLDSGTNPPYLVMALIDACERKLEKTNSQSVKKLWKNWMVDLEKALPGG